MTKVWRRIGEKVFVALNLKRGTSGEKFRVFAQERWIRRANSLTGGRKQVDRVVQEDSWERLEKSICK